MAEPHKSQPSIMSPFILSWDFDSLRAADEEMFDDGSELSDALSLQSSMDLDMGPFQSDVAVDPTGFSVQNLLPLEVRFWSKQP